MGEKVSSIRKLSRALGADRETIKRCIQQCPEECPKPIAGPFDVEQWRTYMSNNLRGPYSHQRQYGENAPKAQSAQSAPDDYTPPVAALLALMRAAWESLLIPDLPEIALLEITQKTERVILELADAWDIGEETEAFLMAPHLRPVEWRAFIKANANPSPESPLSGLIGDSPQVRALCLLVNRAWESFLIDGITETELGEIWKRTVLMVGEIADGWEITAPVKRYVVKLLAQISAGPRRI